MTVNPKYSIPGLIVAGAGIVWFFQATIACGCSPKEKAWEATIKSDLRAFRYAQEEFFADSGRFAASLDEIGSELVISRDVTIIVDRAEATRFTATGAHELLAERACHLEVGEATRDSLWCYDR